jgi:hypothetical protein
MDGPLIGGAGLLLAGQIALSSMAVRGTGALTARGRLEAWFDMSALTGRRASSKLPHIPQKRKVFALSSPHFGQITIVSPNLYSKFKLAPRFSQASSTLFCSY